MSENASLRHLRSQAEAFFGLAMDPNFFGRVKLTLNFDSTLAQGATAILKSVPLNPASKGNMESSSSTRRRKRRRKSKKIKKKNDNKAAASEGQPAAAAAAVTQQKTYSNNEPIKCFTLTPCVSRNAITDTFPNVVSQ